jgi:protein-S-isoprenylcysteine O-methyltransferase Ste14
VRHPAHAGSVLHLLAIGIAFDNLLSIVACLAFGLLGVLGRIKVEEEELQRALGPPYREYAARTSRLIPRIW